jgi:hydroxymethylbilane synthase
VFIKELEIALEKNEIDAAVHSLKDVPSELGNQFTIAAVLERAAMEDVLISASPYTLETLPAGSRVGTSSVRRARQLQWLRPDLQVVELRGNVPTRIRKCLGEGALDAIVLAAAGLVRLSLLDLTTNLITIDDTKLHAQVLDPIKFYPAAGQGAIAIEVRSKDYTVLNYVRSLNHAETESRIVVEREFLRLMGAGCQTPVGVRTWIDGGRLHMAVRVFSEQDLQAKPIEAERDAPLDCPLSLAKRLASDVG